MRALSSSIERVSLEVAPDALFDSPPEVRFQSERVTCDCGAALLVQKTRQKHVWTMVGPFVAHETVHHCVRCDSKYTSEALRNIVAPGCNVAYDVLIFIGKALFQRYRTVQEVRRELTKHNVRLSYSEVDYLGSKFIRYLACAHRRAVPSIREAMSLDGGYVLHLDAMHAQGAPVLMTGVDGLSHIVLGSAKLAGEKADSIEPFLRDLRDRFGKPVACVHDMGSGICNAVESVFDDVPDFICHFHFLRDAGSDLLGPSYAILRKRLRKHSISSRLHALVREMREQLTQQQSVFPDIAQHIGRGELPADKGAVPAAVAYVLAQWALTAKQSGHGYGFPFDRPLLCFADRLLQLKQDLPRFMHIYLRENAKDNEPLLKLHRHLWRLDQDAELKRAVKDLHWRSTLFDSLRHAMRIAPYNGTSGLNEQGANVKIGTIRSRVQQFRSRIRNDPELADDRLFVKLAEQIDNYTEKLFADPISVDGPEGQMIIQPQRTNNLLEQFFRGVRRGYRRRTGNNSMAAALQGMLAETPLVKNLDNTHYMRMLLGDNADLEELFAQIDAEQLNRDEAAGIDEQSSLPGVKNLINLPELPGLISELFNQAK